MDAATERSIILTRSHHPNDQQAVWDGYVTENQQICKAAAQRLGEAFAEIEDTVYEDDPQLLISMLQHAEPGSQLADFARALLGIPLK